MFLRRFAASVLLLSAIASPGTAGGTGEPGAAEAAVAEYLLRDLPAVPDALRRAALAGRADEALRLARELADHDEAQRPFWLLIEGVILQQTGEHARALSSLAQAESAAAAAGSPWLHKLRFARAASHRALGQWKQVEEIFEAETDRLRSGARQQDLAAVVLAFADASSTAREDAPPSAGLDYEKAGALYRQVLEMEVPDDTREYAQWRVGFCARERGDWHGAIAAWLAWLDGWDPAWRAARGVARARPQDEAPARLFDVRLAYARALQTGVNDPAGAARALEDLAALVEGFLAGQGLLAGLMTAPGEAERARLAELRGEAAYLAGLAHGLAGRNEQRIGGFRRFLEAFPRHPRASEAAFGIALGHAEAGRHEEAIAAWEGFLARPKPPADGILGVGLDAVAALETDARLRMRAHFLAAESRFALGRFEEAGRAYAAYTALFPTGPDWAGAQEGVVRAAYESGADLMRRRDYAGARAAWTRFLEDQPLHSGAQEIFFAIGELHVLEGRDLDDEAAAAPHYEAAASHWADLAARWPGSEAASHALFARAVLLEERLGRLKEAIAVYQRCDFGAWAHQARARLQRMLEEDLNVTTERTYRNGEKVRMQCDLRNLDELQVEIYPLDLEAYFRKHLTHEGVGSLDLDLIAPAASFAWPVPDYAPFAPLRREIELPVEGHGAWAVAISASDLRATTLVLRSDLDLLVKSSREELLALAVDMERGAGAAGVRVVVAGGATVTEIVTGADGVARLAWSQHGGQAPDDLHVYASSPLGAATTQLGLGGLASSRGLGARGHIASDRPAYRPGEQVNWRAVVREADGGRYAFRAGEKWRVSLSDPLGRALHSEVLELSEFGTLAGVFPLASDAVSGDYQIRCSAPDGITHQGGFLVGRFELPKAELLIEADREVVFRGETVALRVTARTWFGEPLADAPLRLDLPDGRRLDLRTDAEGVVRAEFATRGREESGWLDFGALLPEAGVGATARAFLAPTGFQASVAPERGLVLAGESFAVEVGARSWSGGPMAAKLRLTVVRRELVAGIVGETVSVPDVWSERTVHEQTMETDAATGLARAQLSLEEGGDYRLRVLGEDRFANPVSAEAQLEVSGADDATKLRFLTERARVAVGERVDLDLHNRAAGGVGLITFLGAGVLDYRVVTLREGVNPIAFEADASFWPNFAVAADLIGERAWHSTSVSLLAERALSVEIAPLRQRWRPGEQVEVELTARDQLGAPVEAEIAFGVVDLSLLALFPDLSAPLDELFLQGVMRRAEMRTAATTLFSYEGDTRFVAQEILDEKLAQEAAELWEQRREEVGVWLARPQSEPQAALGAMLLDQAETESALRSLGYAGEGEDWNDAVGMGGGAGGKYGGRGGRGGRRGGAPGTPSPDAGQNALEGGLGEALAHWDARVRTGPDGRATVRFTMPQRSTRWRVLARGVGPETLLGQSEAEIESRADFLVELRAPARLVEGDRPAFGARIHNLSGADGVAEVTLELGDGERTWTVPARARFEDGARSAEVEFAAPQDLILPPGGALRAEVRAVGRFGEADLAAAATRVMPVRAWGTSFDATAAGTLGGGRSVSLALPAGHDWHDARLEVLVGRGLEAWLLAEALGDAAGPRGPGVAPPLRPDLAAELIGVCAVIAYAESGGRASAAELGALRARAAGLSAALVASQARDGSWSWSAGGPASDETTSRALWALCDARDRGVYVQASAIEAAAGRLQTALRGLPGHALEETAMALHALARAGVADFGVANRLHRSRNEMNAAALAHTTLALASLSSGPMAGETAALLAERFVPKLGWPGEGCRGWNQVQAERNALCLLALVAARLRSDVVGRAAELVADARPWPVGGARGLALAALSERLEDAVPAADDFEVVVEAAGDSRTLRFAGAAGVQRLEFALGDASRAELRLEVFGRGTPVFSARLSGFSRSIVPFEHPDLRVTRHFLAAPPIVGGSEIPTGFGVLAQSDESWQNEVSQCGLGSELIGQVDWMKRWLNEQSELEGEYLLLDVPLPQGARVVPGSVSGSLESWQEDDGVLRVRIGRTRHGGSVVFRLVGVAPGSWRVAPAVLRSAYDAARRADGEAGEMRVLARGETSDDAYRATPDELFHAGKALYAAGELAGAAERLQALMDGWERSLRDDVLREAAEMLLYAAIAREDAPRIVRYFEILREKSPELTVPFEQVIVVGRAYRRLGEHERAARIFQAVLEETFGKDLRVAGVLQQQGDFVGSADALYRLWLEFPDLPAVQESALALADQLLQRAPDAHLDPALLKAGYDRAALIGVSVHLLRAFQAFYAADPLAADAGLNLISAHLSLEDYERAAGLAAEMAARFAEPRWSDTFAYTEAVADWYLGREDAATGLLQRIADAVYVAADGSESRSINRELAIYILGQIYHARQDFERAAEFYGRVANAFSDARDALADFRERRLEVEEVVTARPGESARLEVRHRNLAEAEVLVYPVDLLTLTLRERNLSGITGVNLSGIEPTMRKTLKLKPSEALRLQTTELKLDLREAGAYLVMLRGEELHASGLVLVSDLEIEVREDAVQGRLRVQALERGDGAYLRDVDVRVIGSANAGFTAGKTDPRGIYTADGLAGTSTVIARWGDRHFAFFRGAQALGAVAQERKTGAAGGLQSAGQQLEAGDYLSNVMNENSMRQAGRSANLRQQMDKDRSGVQVLQVK